MNVNSLSCLGSRLNHFYHRNVNAIATADRKFRAGFSYRVAIRREYFSEQNARAIRLHSRYAIWSYGMSFLRTLVEGIMASARTLASVLRRLLASYSLSATGRRGAGIVGAAGMSATVPGVR